MGGNIWFLKVSMVLAWIKFLICAGLIGVSGPALSRYGDIIARRTGLSRSWIGLLLLATATSLPELFTGISSVTVANAPNIALGDALGSCVFNLLILVVFDLLYREEPVYGRMDQGHILTAGFGVIMIGFVGAAILLSFNGGNFTFYFIGLYTPILVITYLVAMRAAFFYEKRRPAVETTADDNPDITLKKAIIGYLMAAAVIVGAGAALPFVGIEIADAMGWRRTFVGTLFIAAATSLPELVVGISALRLRALDMATANLLGSNLFDVLIIAIDDIAYTKGPLLAAVSPAHAITAFAAVIMSGIVIVGLLYKPATRLHGTIGWVSLSLLVIYVFSSYMVYLQGG